MNDLAKSRLLEIIQNYGISVIDEPHRVEALLRDLCGNCRVEIAVLLTALKERVPQTLLTQGKAVSLKVLAAQLTGRLQDNHAIEQNAAQWAVETWAVALNLISYSISTGGGRTMYSAEISRRNPGCFLFLVDQSYSMRDPFGSSESGNSKAKMLADAINRSLLTLVGRCSKDEGVRRYFQVGVIGYGATIGPAMGGDLIGRELVWVDELAAHPLRVEERQQKVSDGMGGLVEVPKEFVIWFDPVANNGTPMCRALWQAHAILETWVAQHPEAFPPVVINISDGESTDGDPLPPSEAIRELTTTDGNVLLLNLHLSSLRGMPTLHFPNNGDNLPDDSARLLFWMSSTLPPHMGEAAHEKGFLLSDNARGFVFNANIEDVIEFIDIGTRPSNMR